jgi:hypothetical protein
MAISLCNSDLNNLAHELQRIFFITIDEAKQFFGTLQLSQSNSNCLTVVVKPFFVGYTFASISLLT